MSSPLGREVRFQHNSLTTQLGEQEKTQQEKHIKTSMTGGKGDVKQKNEEQFKCVTRVRDGRQAEGHRQTVGGTLQVWNWALTIVLDVHGDSR